MKYNFNVEKINPHLNIGYGGTSSVFSCPFCRGLCAHNWQYALKSEVESSDNYLHVICAECQSCIKSSYWLKNGNEETLLYPNEPTDIELPNPDMPIEIKKVYNESAKILSDSPRASAALSRLAIDMLTKTLTSGDNLNKRIGTLVTNGLPQQIQMALDAIRVIGNNAIHPGEIDMSDDKEVAIVLLKLLNNIVENQISREKEIKKIYDLLPKGALEAINRRDSKV